MQAVTQADIIKDVEEVEIKLTSINISKFLSPELYYYWKLERFSICRGVSPNNGYLQNSNSLKVTFYVKTRTSEC